MNVEIQNCNNIDSAKITITKNKLNIKFAHNGTGKSTIAKALQCFSAGDKDLLADLMPFKYRDSNPNNLQPIVSCMEKIRNIMCFNEDYVNQFTFKPEELVSNSFDIFIRTDAYRAIEQEIASIVQTIRQQFTNNSDLETLISNLKGLSDAFKLTASGQLSKSSAGMKGLSVGNKITNIPQGLEPYQPFIQSPKSVNWIDWQTKGHLEYSTLSTACPFCSTDSTGKKEQIRRVSQEYDKNVIKNLVGIIDVLDKLGEYFSVNAKENLEIITSLKEGLEKEHENFIVELKNQIDTLVQKLEDVRTLSSFHFKEGEKVAEKLISYKLDLHFLSHLNSVKTQATITSINSSLDVLITQAGELQGKINRQRKEIQKLIEKHQADINSFLAYAGYRYKVEIAGEHGRSQLKLLHVDHSQHLSGGHQHLSFGERNAFAIVLFMYECLAKAPDLIILDDPISSFDKNKKFAILEMLFRRDGVSCLKGKTVLMLTHDIEPIIDTLKSVKKQFSNQVTATYLRYNSGHVHERSICEKDIKTFAQICQTAVNSDCDNIIKLIYLRRYYEIMDDHGEAYQVLSNLFHKRKKPLDSREPLGRDGKYPEMDPAKLSNGIDEIRKNLPGFDYENMLRNISDTNSLKFLYHDCQNGYEKLQVFRLIGIDIENSIIQKFINETYHIENEFICQLDPTQFDLVPEYIVDECSKKLQEVK
ncbi:AAA family ATPase [Legionella qingyii]|uniref:AAA family ATPase n=1 Tax=Legionella qingyii TaxID=2184757 RepID=A0A317U2S7_9GAMM|nr:AAA family ATPase [Legionella qingyii]PWY54610.1 AAA family ATPase [Legionella qingyii]PWY55490.1 AAA family ATPase [Legionella qingyii]RUR21501.1 AAA family ATPase [Legionella qingyii]